MFFGALGTQALGEVRRLAVSPAPTPTPGGAGDASAGGSAWDERFLRPARRLEEPVLDDEEGLILAYWYARENRML